MNHDVSHCADYDAIKCPKSCYRAALAQDLKDRWMESMHMPISWAHFMGTEQCERKDDVGGTHTAIWN